MATDTVTVTLSTDSGDDELEVPAALFDVLGEENDDPATVVGDIAMLGLAQQVHGIVHHGQAGGDAGLADAESVVMDRFEERFGQTFAEVTGHGH